MSFGVAARRHHDAGRHLAQHHRLAHARGDRRRAVSGCSTSRPSARASRWPASSFSPSASGSCRATARARPRSTPRSTWRATPPKRRAGGFTARRQDRGGPRTSRRERSRGDRRSFARGSPLEPAGLPSRPATASPQGEPAALERSSRWRAEARGARRQGGARRAADEIGVMEAVITAEFAARREAQPDSNQAERQRSICSP